MLAIEQADVYTMTLEQNKFDLLIQRLERFAAKKPAAYKFCVALIAALGYSYIIIILIVTLSLLLGLIWLVATTQPTNASSIKGGIQAFIFLLGLVLVLSRSLWVSFSPPTDLSLKREDVPKLFTFVDELSLQLKAPYFHHILITDKLNAGVIQRPRLGLFGWYENYLIVGLPLMLALSSAQFRAVLAHELGHLSGNHSRFGSWIYRQRLTWFQLFQRLQTNDDLSRLIFVPFARWYMPFFQAYSFVLARLNEYEADRCAAEISGAKNVATTLATVKIKAQFLEKSFWSSIYDRVTTEIEPPQTAFTDMQVAFLKEIPLADAKLFLSEALTTTTNNADTHPCLTDRLKALGFFHTSEEIFSLFSPIQTNAAEELLGNALDGLINNFNRDWQLQMATPWRQKYVAIQESIAQLQKLDANAEQRELTEDETWERIQLTFELKGGDAVVPLLQAIIQHDNNNASANYWLGQILLSQQNERGIEYIEKAMAKNSNTIVDGCEAIAIFLEQQGNIDAARSYQKRAEEYHNLTSQAHQERNVLNLSDRFVPHGLSDSDLQNLCQQFSQHSEITTVYLVQKVVEYFTEKPLYVIGILREVGFWGESDAEEKNSQIHERLYREIEFHSEIFILILNGQYNRFENKFRKVPNALVYRKANK